MFFVIFLLISDGFNSTWQPDPHSNPEESGCDFRRRPSLSRSNLRRRSLHIWQPCKRTTWSRAYRRDSSFEFIRDGSTRALVCCAGTDAQHRIKVWKMCYMVICNNPTLSENIYYYYLFDHLHCYRYLHLWTLLDLGLILCE